MLFRSDPDYVVSGFWRGMVARLFPKWVLSHRGRVLLRCPPGRVLAMEALGIAPPKPWLFNSSHADLFHQESDAMLEYYADAGMPREQMAVAGSTADDVMADVLAHYDERRAELFRSLGLAPGRKVLLTALPPNFLDQPGGRPECEFREYESLVEFWLRACGDAGCNVVVALHPSVPFEQAHRFERYGARVSPLPTAALVPLCDIFVASISSTIRWAIACCKSVVNYDVYRYRYTDFIGVDGVLTTESRVEFAALMRRLVEDEFFSADIAEKQCRIAERWGRLDGCSGKRMVSLVDRLLAAPHQANAAE